MFKYSIDEFIASKQQEQADKLLDEMSSCCELRYSKDIEDLFNKVTFEYLEQFVKVVKLDKESIIIPAIPRNSSGYRAKMDLKKAFDLLEKSWLDPLPYIEYSFPEDYHVPHGESYRHCYFVFVTKYREFKASEECVKHYLSRVNNLKVFL